MIARYFVAGLMILIFAEAASAQLCFPVKKAYAFFQPVTAGTMSKAEANNRQPRGNYLVYVTSKSEGITLNNIWINGVLQHATLKEIITPVVMPAAPAAKNTITLVPASNKKTYQLLFTGVNAESSSASIPKKYASLPCVLELQYKKKKKFITVDSIRQLEIMPLY